MLSQRPSRLAHPHATRAMRRFALALLAIAGAAPAAAQQSASFQLREHVMNAGGRPANGIIAQSASFRVSLDAIGEAVSQTGLLSGSFWMDGGFVAPYPPPEEVVGVRFADLETLTWKPEKSTGSYDVYRGLVSSLPGLEYGTCFDQGLADETATDTDLPGLGQIYFYLVTAENLLGERSTKGFASNGNERANNAPCP